MAASDSFDDIFDEDVDENVIQQKEWNKLKSQILKEGYRDGVSEGEELSLQEGFNFGYGQIVKVSYNFGKLRGQISALLALNQLGKNVFTSREKNNPVSTSEETTNQVSASGETTNPVFTSGETTDANFISRETTGKELEDILQEVINFENKLKKSVTSKCAEFATVELSTSEDVSVCSCDRTDHCPVCYGDTRDMVSDLGLDDLDASLVIDKQNLNRQTASAESSTRLCLEQISSCYCKLLDEAKSMLNECEQRVEKLVKENVVFQ